MGLLRAQCGGGRELFYERVKSCLVVWGVLIDAWVDWVWWICRYRLGSTSRGEGSRGAGSKGARRERVGVRRMCLRRSGRGAGSMCWGRSRKAGMSSVLGKRVLLVLTRCVLVVNCEGGCRLGVLGAVPCRNRKVMFFLGCEARR